MKEEFKEVCRRSAANGELTSLKSVLLDFPPLHGLNDILDDMSMTPNTKMERNGCSPRNAATPQTTTRTKKRSASGISATKSLRFSPHLFKTEPNTTGANEYSPDGVLDLVPEENGYKAEAEDDVIEIDGL